MPRFTPVDWHTLERLVEVHRARQSGDVAKDPAGGGDLRSVERQQLLRCLGLSPFHGIQESSHIAHVLEIMSRTAADGQAGGMGEVTIPPPRMSRGGLSKGARKPLTFGHGLQGVLFAGGMIKWRKDPTGAYAGHVTATGDEVHLFIALLLDRVKARVVFFSCSIRVCPHT
jgi:hypothetical protein